MGHSAGKCHLIVMAHMGLILRVGLILLAFLAPAAAEQPVRIGVLSYRPVAQTLQQWAPTAEYLSRSIPGHVFQVLPMNYPDLDRAVKEGQLDFVLTNPDHFVLLRNQTSLAPILTIMPLANDHPVTSFGGVIVTRSTRQDINRLEDLAGRSVAAPSEESLGGNLMQLWELYRRGIAFPHIHYLGMPHDLSVQAVMSGSADAAFVRTGVLEGLVREGRLKATEFKVINAQPDGDFPQLLSTALYPEWPFCSARKTPEDLVKSVSMALLSLEPSDPAAKAGGYFGFSPPGDYSAVEAVMLRLRVHPGPLAQFDLRDVIAKYSVVLVASLIALVLVMAAVAIYLTIVNRASTKLLKERDAAQLALRDNIRQLEETNRELEQFAYVASHDLREPLRMVSSYMALLERRYGGTLDKDGHEFLAFAKEGAVRMDSLVQDLLDFSRIGRTTDPLQLNPLGELVARALDSLKVAIRRGNAEVEVASQLPIVLCRGSEIVRVFQNLIDNAVKFRAPDRDPLIEISCQRQDKVWLFSISDNGIGIDPAYADRVFTIFQRLHTRDRYEGNGIGLAECKKIIAQHGGRIWVESIPNQGSTFFFTLPANPVAT